MIKWVLIDGYRNNLSLQSQRSVFFIFFVFSLTDIWSLFPSQQQYILLSPSLTFLFLLQPNPKLFNNWLTRHANFSVPAGSVNDTFSGFLTWLFDQQQFPDWYFYHIFGDTFLSTINFMPTYLKRGTQNTSHQTLLPWQGRILELITLLATLFGNWMELFLLCELRILIRSSPGS